MKVGEAVAEIMKREGIEILCGYPVNHLLEYAAAADIRPIIVRQERIGLHMADAISRVTSGRKIGAFCMQHGPGSENAYGGVAQSYSKSVPLLVIPQGYPRRIAGIDPNYSASREMRHVAKISEHLIVPGEIANAMRRAFSNLRNGRSGPAIVEIPTDLWNEDIGTLDYTPVSRAKSGPDPADVRKAAAAILAAKRPVIYAGTGVHWAEAWPQLRKFAELLGAPVTTSLGGKSSFPENHPLSLGSGGNAVPKTVHHFVEKSRSGHRHRLLVHRDEFRHQVPQGEDVHPCDARSQSPEQGRGERDRTGRRCRPDIGCADRRAVAVHQVQPRPEGRGGGDHLGARGVDGAVEAAAQLERSADQPVSRDLGADGRRPIRRTPL